MFAGVARAVDEILCRAAAYEGRGGMSYGRQTAVLALDLNPWHGRRLGRQHLLSKLAQRGWDVAYSTGAYSLWQRGTEAFRRAPWWPSNEMAEGVTLDVPGKLLPRSHSRPYWDALAVAWHAGHLRRLAKPGGGPLMLLVYHPAFWPYVEALKPRWVVYHAYDDFARAPGWNKRWARMEAALLERADVLLATSLHMADRFPEEHRRRVRELPNGVDFEAFRQADLRCPDALVRIPAPRVGSIGTINHKLDMQRLRELAEARPQWNFVFVGNSYLESLPSEAEARDSYALWQALRQLPNVHYLGPCPYEQVPAYVANCEVNIACYRLEGGWWVHGFPLKLFDPLVFGKAAICSPLKSVEPYAEVVDLARTKEDWLGAIERALVEDDPARARARIECAQSNSWNSRVDKLEGWLQDLLR
ncbi:MAG: glycosyltransferase [Bryobacter sp.]|nr:glycosyltransferase [Bryobacter sp.]